MSVGIYIVGILILTAILLRVFRMKVLKWAMNLRAILRIRSLRVAIKDADEDKETTDRKNMVVFNTHSGHYEPVQKKLLKTIEKKGKNKSNAKMTKGRKWFLKNNPMKKKKILNAKVIEIENKSLYVTK